MSHSLAQSEKLQVTDLQSDFFSLSLQKNGHRE